MSAPDLLLRWLVDGTLAASAAVLLVMLMRRPLRRAFGAQTAYGAWALVPLALIAAALPRPEAGLALTPALLAVHPGALLGVLADAGPAGATMRAWDLRWLAVLGWFAGAVVLASAFVRQQRRYVAALGPLRRDADGQWRGRGVPGPAVVGALRPRIVLPSDFEARHGAAQANLVLAHERTHLARGDTRANLLAVVLRCLQWFNPLLHLAARRFRLDQELACDAAVLARHPHARRRYADAMLNVQLAVPGLPVGCHWQSSQSLKERLQMLKQPQPGPARRRVGLVVLGTALLACSYAAWAVRPAAVPDVPPAPPAPADPAAPAPPPVPPAPAAPPAPVTATPPPAAAAPEAPPAPPPPAAPPAPPPMSAPAPPTPPAAPRMPAPRDPAEAAAFGNGKPVEGRVRVPVDLEVPEGAPGASDRPGDHG